MTTRKTITALVTLVGLAAVAAADDHVDPGAEVGKKAFLDVARVLQSPRCMNCHPAGDAPHVGDEGRVHRMNVSRRSPEAGLPCSTCHRSKNAHFEHGPPGVPGWQMPPADHPMPFEKRSAHDLCEQIKDPQKNGGKSLADLHGHFARDPLVVWAWDPGPGRTVPPLPQAELVRQVDAWIAAGAPCPR